ncbi:MAG: TraR/DksA family transcriptional regulator [Deltaproteobacteria bacterium]|nr:TraR/DksA family transcriptional regulator [Deltaproteobacteria bacterium]
MRKRDLDKFKKLLYAERQAIIQHLTDLQAASEGEISDTGGDSVDLASIEITQANIQKLGTREKKLLKKIDHALAKFETGEFGICEQCGEGIAPARLEARPVAQYCIDCKTELEQNERRYTDRDAVETFGGQTDEFDDSLS